MPFVILHITFDCLDYLAIKAYTHIKFKRRCVMISIRNFFTVKFLCNIYLRSDVFFYRFYQLHYLIVLYAHKKHGKKMFTVYVS